MSDDVNAATTWHYGLVARWWALFNVDGPEIEFFRRYVEAGQPALDLACGTGRLLVPYVREGFDVDGVDVSPDMLDYCRAAVEATGAPASLYAQAIHQLDLPRRYRTVFCCGGFGLGTTAEQDEAGLRRVLAHLEPGGTFVVDNEVGEADPARWRRWEQNLAPRDATPPAPAERRRGPDGDDYALSHQLLAVDAASRRGVRELRAWRWHDGDVVAAERHQLIFGAYTADRLVELLTDAGFVDIRVLGGYDGAAPGPQHEFLVFEAHRAG
jgi:SAM-dependent methyltransferase